jgi:hypothetical protein
MMEYESGYESESDRLYMGNGLCVKTYLSDDRCSIKIFLQNTQMVTKNWRVSEANQYLLDVAKEIKNRILAADAKASVEFVTEEKSTHEGLKFGHMDVLMPSIQRASFSQLKTIINAVLMSHIPKPHDLLGNEIKEASPFRF